MPVVVAVLVVVVAAAAALLGDSRWQIDTYTTCAIVDTRQKAEGGRWQGRDGGRVRASSSSG